QRAHDLVALVEPGARRQLRGVFIAHASKRSTFDDYSSTSGAGGLITSGSRRRMRAPTAARPSDEATRSSSGGLPRSTVAQPRSDFSSMFSSLSQSLISP